MRIFSNSALPSPIVAVDKTFKFISVEVPISPVNKLDCVANIATKNFKTKVSNQQSVAWEKYINKVIQLEDSELNFVRDFYVESAKSPVDKLSNFHEKLLNTYLQSTRTAYESVQMVVQQLITQEMIEVDKVARGRKFVLKALKEKLESKKNQFNESNLKWQFEVKRLYSEIKEVVKHILHANGEAKFQRLHDTIQKKKHITVEFVKGLPRQTAIQLTDILQQIRQLLSKKTDEIALMKEVHGEDFMMDSDTMKELSETEHSQTVDGYQSQSGLTNSVRESKKKQTQDLSKISPFFDVTTLQKKWKMSNPQVKSAIRRLMVTSTLQEAEKKKAETHKKKLMETGQWGKIQYPKPKRLKTQREIYLDEAKTARAGKKEAQKVDFHKAEVLVEKDVKAEAVKHFFDHYDQLNPSGERFDSACRYAKLFV